MPPTYEALERKFREKIDPWNFGKSQYEQQRFEKMLALIKTVPHKRILEIGCAEGHFTEKLSSISQDVTAIDLSEEALKRAKVRAPKANYIRTTLENMQIPELTYDLVVCSEVIYYIRNKKAAVNKIKKLGHFLLLCNFSILALIVEPYFRSLARLKRIIHFRLSELKICSISLWKIK